MADKTTPIDLLSAGTANNELRINELFDAASPAMLYGRRAATTTGLTWGYFGGRVGSGSALADGTVTLTGSSTNYVVADVATGLSVTVSAVDTNWSDTANYVHLYKITTDATKVTNYEDHRIATGGGTGGGGGGGGSGTGTSLTFTSDIDSQADSDPGNGVLKWNNATQASATVLYIDNQTADAVSLTTFYAALQPGGFIYLQQSSNAGLWQLWRVSTITAGSGYYKFGVTLQASAGSIVDAEEIAVDFKSGRIEVWSFACSDRSTALTTGTNKGSIHAPYAARVVEVQAGLNTAQASGSIFTVDVNEAGTTILSTKLTIDNTEDTSVTAATPPVISDNLIAKGAKVSADVDQIGNGTAVGLVVYLTVIPQ